MENKKPNKITTEFMEQLSPYLQNATMFYGAALAVGLMTLVFITWPAISQHMDLSDQIAQNEKQIEKIKEDYETLNEEYEDRLARVKKSNTEVKTVFENEVLPTDENLTELVRYLERKIAELNISEKEYITLSGINFGKAVSDGDVNYVTAKLTVNSNPDNFYRFLQILESSGMKVGVTDVKEFGAAHRAGLRDGDVIKTIYSQSGEPSPAIIPSVIAENLLSLKAEESVKMDIVRYSDVMKKWQASTVTYTVEKEDEGIGATLGLDENYGRLIGINKIAAKISEDEKNINAQKNIDFSVEFNAYYAD